MVTACADQSASATSSTALAALRRVGVQYPNDARRCVKELDAVLH